MKFFFFLSQMHYSNIVNINKDKSLYNKYFRYRIIVLDTKYQVIFYS